MIRVFLYYHRRVDPLGKVEDRYFDLLLKLLLQTAEHKIFGAYEAVGGHRGGASEESVVAVAAFLRSLRHLLEILLVSRSSLSLVFIMIGCCLMGSSLSLSEGDWVSDCSVCCSAGVHLKEGLVICCFGLLVDWQVYVHSLCSKSSSTLIFGSVYSISDKLCHFSLALLVFPIFSL